MLEFEDVARFGCRRHWHGSAMLYGIRYNLVPLTHATCGCLAVGLPVPVIGELVDEIADAAVLHLDLLDLLVLV